MSKIHELSETLTNQIAAGEVIERPASVVKELVENSLDAGATRIRVDFVDAGLKQIVVQDNGTGIARDQVDLAFTRHATSKIANEHDLFKVSTLGFRGEALASISAVSHVEILTATENAIGIRANYSGGNKKVQEDAAARKGTKITVKDLFFNTPARLKYLRSPRTEIMKIVDIINRLALGYPHVSFTLSNTDKILLRTPGNNNLKQTVANVYGRHIAEKMEKFEAKDSDFKITGLMSKPELTRSTRNFISILLNGRYIKNFQLNTAILDGYGSKLAARHYPIIVLAIKVDPLLVDVNVHPTKQEVRLSKEKELGRLITSAISNTLVEKVEQISAFANLENKRDTLVDQLSFNLNQDVVNTARKKEPEIREQEKPKFLTTESDDSEDNIQNEAVKQDSEKKYVDLNQPREDDQYIVTKTWKQNVALQQALTPFPTTRTNQEVISSGDETLANNQQLQTLESPFLNRAPKQKNNLKSILVTIILAGAMLGGTFFVFTMKNKNGASELEALSQTEPEAELPAAPAEAQAGDAAAPANPAAPDNSDILANTPEVETIPAAQQEPKNTKQEAKPATTNTKNAKPVNPAGTYMSVKK